jgi:hypothetical protein
MFTFSYPSTHCSCYLFYDWKTRHEYLAATSSCAGIVSQGRGCSFRSGIILWVFLYLKEKSIFETLSHHLNSLVEEGEPFTQCLYGILVFQCNPFSDQIFQKLDDVLLGKNQEKKEKKIDCIAAR